ncbi:MAG: hypothetical protein ACRBCK_01030 [Alphaproteobacteria bacterium]
MPNSNEILAAIAHGHADGKHFHEFREAGFDVKGPQDVADLMQKTLNDPATKVAMDLDTGTVVIVNNSIGGNSGQGIAIALNPNNNDPGSVYPVSSSNKFTNMTSQMGDNMVVARNLGEANAMVDRFSQNVELTPRATQNLNSSDVQASANALEATAQANELIVPSEADVQSLDQNVEKVVEVQQEAQRQQEIDRDAQRAKSIDDQQQANMRKEVIAVANADGTDVVASQADNAALIEGSDKSNYQIEGHPDGTSTVTKFDPDGAQAGSIDLNVKNTQKLMSGLKGLAEVVVAPILVGTVALVSGATPAQAAEAAGDSILENTLDSDGTAQGVATGLAKDAVAVVAPKTVEAVNNDASALEVTNSALKDTMVAGGCYVGGAIGAAGGATISSPTVLGVPVATAAGAVGGCYVGSKVAEGVVSGVEAAGKVIDNVVDAASETSQEIQEMASDAIDKAEKAIDNVIDYFAGDDAQEPPLNDVREILPKEPVEGMQPEIQAMVEVQSSDMHLQDVMTDMKVQGSAEFVVPQLEDRKGEIGHEITADIAAQVEADRELELQQQLIAQQAQVSAMSSPSEPQMTSP